MQHLNLGQPELYLPNQIFKTERYVKEEMKKIGLEVKEDAIGNIYGILKGEDPTLAPVWTGSHIDTVPNAGKFDGMAGVVCGMEEVKGDMSAIL